MSSYIPLLSDIFGQKPDIVPFKKIDFGASQIKSIQENLAAFPKIKALGTQFQDYMTNAYNKAIPNFSSLLEMGGQTTENILKAAGPLIRGEIPDDVKAQVLRSGAFQALGKGAQFIHGLQARDLGRTSLDMMTQGANLAGAGASAAQRWAGLASGLIMNPAGFLITPKDQANLDLQQALIKREVDQARANVNAAPNPVAKGLSDLVAYLTASYIGRGPAGKPPDAPKYDAATAIQPTGAVGYPGGPNDPAWASLGVGGGSGGFTGGDGGFGGGGGGSSFALSPDSVNQANDRLAAEEPGSFTLSSDVTQANTPGYTTDWNPSSTGGPAYMSATSGAGSVGGPSGDSAALLRLLGIGNTQNPAY